MVNYSSCKYIILNLGLEDISFTDARIFEACHFDYLDKDHHWPKYFFLLNPSINQILILIVYVLELITIFSLVQSILFNVSKCLSHSVDQNPHAGKLIPLVDMNTRFDLIFCHPGILIGFLDLRCKLLFLIPQSLILLV